jgi:hypothetical protein
LSETLKGRDYLEDVDIDRRIILEKILDRGCEVDWIHLAQERDQRWVLVNTVMKIWVP